MVTEQTVAGLEGRACRNRKSRWTRGSGPGMRWTDDVHLEGEEVQADADMAARRKRPDAWAVSWEKRRLLILGSTRPNDRGELSLHETDLYKTARYKTARYKLSHCGTS